MRLFYWIYPLYRLLLGWRNIRLQLFFFSDLLFRSQLAAQALNALVGSLSLIKWSKTPLLMVTFFASVEDCSKTVRLYSWFHFKWLVCMWTAAHLPLLIWSSNHYPPDAWQNAPNVLFACVLYWRHDAFAVDILLSRVAVPPAYFYLLDQLFYTGLVVVACVCFIRYDDSKFIVSLPPVPLSIERLQRGHLKQPTAAIC